MIQCNKIYIYNTYTYTIYNTIQYVIEYNTYIQCIKVHVHVHIYNIYFRI